MTLLKEQCFDLTSFSRLLSNTTAEKNNYLPTNYLSMWLHRFSCWFSLGKNTLTAGPGEQQLRAMDCGDIHLSTISCYQDTLHFGPQELYSLYIYIYIHTYTHTYIQTHTHIYIYTYYGRNSIQIWWLGWGKPWQRYGNHVGTIPISTWSNFSDWCF